MDKYTAPALLGQLAEAALRHGVVGQAEIVRTLGATYKPGAEVPVGKAVQFVTDVRYQLKAHARKFSQGAHREMSDTLQEIADAEAMAGYY